MVDSRRESERTRDGVTRRAALRGIVSVSLPGVALTGTASADGLREITFHAANGEALDFQLVVTGRIEAGGDVGRSDADTDAQVVYNVVQGTVTDGRSYSFEFSGDVSVLQIAGFGEVVLDGEVVRDTTGGARDDRKRTDGTERVDGDAKRTDGDVADDAERLPKEVVVSSPGTDEQLDYAFEVTGDLEKLEPDEDSGNARDEVIRRGDRVRVAGTVGTGDDRFAFSGDLVPVEQPPAVRFEVSER